MPYRARIAYITLLSRAIHIPFRWFGVLAGFLMARLELDQADLAPQAALPQLARAPRLSARSRVAVLFSGGTDSTCAAALCAEEFAQVHLLTFEERATRHSPIPLGNAKLLERHFPDVAFAMIPLSVDELVRHFWYERYFSFVRRHGRIALATPGLSSLSWHVRAITYCLEHGIWVVADGLTRELMHFPGHMDGVVEQFRALYAHFGIEYRNPVRAWPVPEDRQLIDQVLVNRHPYEVWQQAGTEKTTGRYLYERGIFQHPNLKGTRQDFSMQHECYPFALYNVIAFWGYLARDSYDSFCAHVALFMDEKIAHARELIEQYQRAKEGARLTALLV